MTQAKWLESEGVLGASHREALKAKFPPEWLLPNPEVAKGSRNILPFFRTSGLLTPRELEITDIEDASSLLERIRGGKWTATEVTLAYCKRASLAQQLVNCLMDIDFEGALSRARELDNHFVSTGSVVGPLHGLPISIKDLTKAKGLQHSFGFVSWAGRADSEDALVVKALRDSGAIIFVKTTMPQTGMALETVSNLWGRTLNPHNTDLSAGGSSGGEGVLGACHGAAVGIATDIGGSIRAPAAFNGLYGLRPSSRRFSYIGNIVSVGGQIAISAVVGPVGRSLRDLDLICRILANYNMWQHDSTVVPLPWTPVETPKKITIGVMSWDEVVMPHPPIQRALRVVVEKLKVAGHEVIEFKPHRHQHGWDITLPLYFPTAGREVKEFLDQGGESLIPSAAKLLEGTRELSVPELLHYHREQKAFQLAYAKHWNATSSQTTSGQPVDAVLMPSMASCSFPHDFFPWWGYLSTWNLLDYPSVIIPVANVEAGDAVDSGYVPISPRDKENYDIYNPGLFEGAPIALQLVGRTFQEEKLLSVAVALDKAL